MATVMLASFRASRAPAFRSAQYIRRFYSAEAAPAYENVLVSKPKPGVGLSMTSASLCSLILTVL